jgi:hypothetical protein
MRRCRRTGLAVLALTIASFATPTPHDVARAGPGGEPTGGPWVHRVVSASSADGLTWTRDDGVRWAHASVPCAVADGDRILLYAVDADRGEGRRESTGLRVSTDGLAFDAAPFVLEGLPTVKALDPCVVRVGPGAFRLYYLASDAPGDPAATRGDHEIHVAVSGRRRAVPRGRRLRCGGRRSWTRRVPRRRPVARFVFARGRTESRPPTTASRSRTRATSTSTASALSRRAARRRTAAAVRVPSRGSQPRNAIVSFVSSDGLARTREAGVRLQATADEQVTDPWVVRWKGGWKMYFKTEPRVDRRGRRAARAAARRGDARPGAPRGDARVRRRGRLTAADRPVGHDVAVVRVAADPADRVEWRRSRRSRARTSCRSRGADWRIRPRTSTSPRTTTPRSTKSPCGPRPTMATFSAPTVIRVEGLPEGMRFPFDPTLVPLPDGRVRLYFTSVPLRPRAGAATPPAIHSAVSKDGVAYVVEPGVRFAVEGRAVVDCAVVLHRGVFHLYAPDSGTGAPRRAPMPPETGRGRGRYHATSGRPRLHAAGRRDGRGRGRWLGNAQSDGTTITFLGTGEGGLWAATSTTGRRGRRRDDGPVSAWPTRPRAPPRRRVARRGHGPAAPRVRDAAERPGRARAAADAGPRRRPRCTGRTRRARTAAALTQR